MTVDSLYFSYQLFVKYYISYLTLSNSKWDILSLTLEIFVIGHLINII